MRGRIGAGQSAVSLITSRLRRSEGCGADWTAHDRATWWVLIAWPLLRVVHLVNGYISQALANREREALADIVADLARTGAAGRGGVRLGRCRVCRRGDTQRMNVTFDTGVRHSTMMNA